MGTNVFGQSTNLVNKEIILISDTTKFDTLLVSKESFELEGLDTTLYTINFNEALIITNYSKPVKVRVKYRTFPPVFTTEYYHKKQEESLVTGETKNPFSYTVRNSKFELIDQYGLNKSGSISRGISFGNNSNLSVNSNLNLQLSGRVTDNVKVLAAITDDNIPIQPDGSTNQLQDFDKVYIQLYNDQTKLITGDFQNKYQDSYFLKYFKKGKGGFISHQLDFKKGDEEPQSMQISSSMAISRGKYSRNIFNGVEGNQGPYRLTGANNERFIIILSGTEIVFIDGKRLKRGQEFDYTIDYNTAEITFTANQLITKDKRIVVEFQYSDQNYARTMFTFSDEVKLKRTAIRFNLYSEQDAKNQSLQQDLSSQQKTVLKNVGDSLNNAVSSSAVLTEYDENRVLYSMIDTLGYDSVFVYSISRTDSLYAVSFSFVGSGLGSYNLSNSVANGRVYEWVGPGNGSYEPIILLEAPEKMQMATIGIDYKLGAGTHLESEVAVSNYDKNTFSTLNQEDNTALAVFAAAKNKKQLNTKQSVRSSLKYEIIGANFNFIERFRSVEFFRDWNLRNNGNEKLQQNIAGAGVSVDLLENVVLSWEGDYFQIENDFQGLKNDVFLLSDHPFIRTDLKGSYLSSNGLSESTSFTRLHGHIIKPIKVLEIGQRFNYENNQRTNSNESSLNGLSYFFNEWETFVQNPDTFKNTFRLGYTHRIDKQPNEDSFSDSTLARSLQLTTQWMKHRNYTIRTQTTYRTLAIKDTSIKSIKADSTLLNRVEYTLRLFKGAIRSNSFYEIGSGMEIKKEFTYLKVPMGQGLYIHNDNNNNGIKELYEFELAPTDLLYQAEYIKVFVPTSEFVKVHKNQFNQTVSFYPRQIWGNKDGLLKFIARFSNQFNYRVERKTNNDKSSANYNPFARDIADSVLVAQSSSLRNNLAFNRSSLKFGADFNYQRVLNKTLLSNGFEQRVLEFYQLIPRWNITPNHLLKLDIEKGIKQNSSDFLSTRNYNIDYHIAEVKYTFQPNNTLRTSLLYENQLKQNNSEIGEKSEINKVGIEFKWSTIDKGAFVSELSYIQIKYPFQNNNSLNFEMLNGLNPGTNYMWMFSYQRTLANNLQVNFTYNGRGGENAKIVHVGGIQARAFF